MSIIEFTIGVPDAVNISAIYDQIQVWRSPNQSGSPTPYIEITAAETLGATLDGDVEGPWALNGQDLVLTVDNADPVTIHFVGSNPFSLTTVINTINSFFAGLASEVPTDTDRIRLTSQNPGTQSALIVGGNAGVTLGLSTSKVNGKVGRPLLSAVTEDYRFRDFDGDPTFWYKNRFFNSKTNAVTAFSNPFLGGPGVALSGSALVTGKIALADLTGAPIVGRRIIFVPVSPQVVSDGAGNNYGILPSVDRITVLTDLNGQASVKLVKNQRLKVFLEGTTFQREFVVPTSDFDLLTTAAAQPDPFDIVTSPPLPIRVSI